MTVGKIMEHKNPRLTQQLSSLHVWALAFGCIIGWGAFINPGKKFLPNSGVYGTAIAMLLGAVVMVILAFSYAYMVPKHPRAGGEFNFTKSCFGKIPAYICGWFLLAAYLSNVPMNSTAIGLIVDGLDGNLDFLKFGFHYVVSGFDVWMGEMLFAMGILILFGILNIWGVRKAGIVQALLSSLLALSVFILTVLAIFHSKASMINMEPVWGFDRAAALAAQVEGAEISSFAKVGSLGIISSVLATFAITPWAFVGFETIPQAAEEFKVSFRKVIFIMIIAILFGAFVYIANNTVAAAAVANWPERVMAGEWVLLIAAEELLGTFGKVLIGVAVSCAVLSGIMGFYLASSRLMYSMGRDGYLPQIFSRIDSRHHTPRNALVFCILVSLSGPILGREALGWFVDMSSIGASIGFFFTAACTYLTMRQDGDGTTFIRIMTMLGMLFSFTFVLLQLVPIPGLIGVHFGKESYWMLVVWITIGFVFSIHQRKYFIE